MAPEIRLEPRFRVTLGQEIALGPGKIALLEKIAATGSIRAAATELGMSYMRAWKLVQTMNGCFKSPVVQTGRGGLRRGGALLTSEGAEIVRLYRTIELEAMQTTRGTWQRIRRLLRE